MKKVLFLVLITIFSVNVFAQNTPQTFDLTQYGVRIEPDKRLMVVLASLEVAGLETPITAQGNEFRQKLRADLAAIDKDLADRMTFFVKQYKNRHPDATQAELLAPFISMAYTLAPVPDLSDPSRTTDLPGALLEVLDYAPLVREFYRRSAMNQKLESYVKDYQTTGDAMRKPTETMVKEVLDYLHTKPQLSYIERIKVEGKAKNSKKTTLQKTEVREHERRFYIVPEMLASKGTINFINAGDDYYAIVAPETDLTNSEVRRAYLQFVLDPLVLNNAKDISTFRDPIKKLLDDLRQHLFEKEKAKNSAAKIDDIYVSPDIYLAVSRSLVAAADAKQIEYKKTVIGTEQARRKIDLMKTVEEKKAVSAELDAFKKSIADETALKLSEDYEKGAVLAFYFADQFKGMEDAGFDIASSLRDMILSLDTTKEANRWAQYADARQRAILARDKNKANAVAVIENPVAKRLLEIDKVINEKNYAKAETDLRQLLQENPTETSRISYALGRVISLSTESISEMDTETRKKRLLEAKAAYEKVLTSANEKTDKAFISLAYVALARIYEFYEETEYAMKVYEAAVRIGNVNGGAYREAVAAIERLKKK